MGCGASSANKAVEPQILSPVPNRSHHESAFHEHDAAQQPAVGPGGVAEQPPEQLPEPLGNAAQDSPNSSKRSGAATPVFEASWKGSEAPMLGGEDDEQDCDTLGSLNGESRLLQFSESRILQYEPSLQDRVSLLETYVQTQNMGKTSKALRAALHSDADDANDAQSEMDLYDLSNPNSELDASWKQKIFSYDGSEEPDALLADVLVDTKWAKEVQIKACKVDFDAVMFLDKIVNERNLRALVIARCNLEDGVVAQIAECLASGRWSSLQMIGLDGNEMVGDASAGSLADALAKNTTLHELSLWGTGLGDAGVKVLATALTSNTTLKNLWLGECEGITDDGAAAIKEALLENTCLEQLALVMTGVSEELQDELEQLMSTRREQRAIAQSQRQ